MMWFRKAVRATGRPFLFGALTGSVLILAAALLLQLSQPRPWQWWEEGPPLPRLSSRVIDDADLLPFLDERKLESQLRALEARTGHHLIVVTVGSLHDQSIEGFGLRLGRSWGVGGKDMIGGVILIIAPNEGLVRIEVGGALEKRLSNPDCARIIREKILPPFEKGDYAKGVEAGTAAIVERIS